MRINATLAATPVAAYPLSAKFKNRAKGVWRVFLALVAAALLVVSGYSATATLRGVSSTPAHALDISKWVMCGSGKDSSPALLYQYAQSNDLQFQAFSKSAASSGLSSPDSGANMLLKVVGVDIEKNNQQLIIGGKDATEGKGFNKGAKLNFFDRFGLGGYQFTAYTGEWNYLVIDACADKPTPKDPKANHYYDTRLDPATTWDRASSSLDPRTQIYANGQSVRHSSAVGTYIGNITLGATTWVVGIFLALLVLSFKDIGQLVGLTKILVGDTAGHPGGILGAFYTNIFVVVAVLFMLFAIGYNLYFILKQEGGPRYWKRIAASLVSGVLTIAAVWQAANIMPIPNKVAAFVQGITIKATTQELTNMGEWCTTEVGAKKSTYKATRDTPNTTEGALKNLEEDVNQVVSENYTDIVASQLSCTFTKLFVFDPWVQGQFGTDANHLWAESKDVPEWAKDGKKVGNSNSAWVGDATVHMGAESTLNNWALYQLSTQTTTHLPTGNETLGKAREAQGVATDWWRVVDAMSNYNEKNVDIKIPRAQDLPASVSDGKWARPAEAVMTSPFGNRPELGDTHKGIDFGAQCGAPIFAAGSGKVVFAQKAGDGANGVIIQHDGVATMYWHMQDGSLRVKVGDEVKAGQQIGSSGDTGHAFGCHLHFEVRPGTDWGNQDNVTDPQPWLKERGIDATKEKDGLDAHAAAVSAGNSSSAIEITRGEQDLNSKPLAYWNTWTGSSSGSRISVGLSSLVVSIIALAVPTIFAFMTASLTIALQLMVLIIPFAGLAVMTGTDRGMMFALKYGKTALWVFLMRVGLGLLMTLSVIFVLWSYSIMEKVGWWQGVLVLALLSVALWMLKDKLLALTETYAGGFVRKPLAAAGKVGDGFKRLTGIGTASAVGGLTAKRAGGSFFAGAHRAGMDKTQDALNRTKAGRLTLQAATKSSNLMPGILKKSRGHTSTIDEPTYVRCTSCGRTFKHGEMQMYRDTLMNDAMYCNFCRMDGLIPKGIIIEAIKNEEDAKPEKKRMTPTTDTYMSMALAKPEVQPEAVTDYASAYKAYETLTSAAASSMARHRMTVTHENHKNIVVYEIPEAFKPYFNVAAYNVARDNDDFERMRRHWGHAIRQFMREELGYEINRSPEETLNDIRRTSDATIPWWALGTEGAKEEKGSAAEKSEGASDDSEGKHADDSASESK